MSNRRGHVPDGRDEVYDALRGELRRSPIGSGPWMGAEANEVIGVVADATERCLVTRLREVDTREVLNFSASALAVAIDENDAARTRETSGRGASLAQMHTQNAAAAHALLEFAARQPVDAQKCPPTRRDLEALSVLAHELWRWRRTAEQVQCRLRRVQAVRLTRRGTFDVDVRDAPPFRMTAYEKKMVARVIDRNPLRGADDAALVQALNAVVSDGGAIPNEFLELDEAMQSDRAYGLNDHLLALELLVLASGWSDPATAGSMFRPDSLATRVREGVSEISPRSDPDRVVEATRWLTWTHKLLLASPLQLLQDRTSAARLYSRPVLELSDGGLFVPRHAPGRARVVLYQRLLEGTWPEQLVPADTRMPLALERRRSRVRPVEGFEAHIAAVLRATGLPHAPNVLPSGPNRISEVLGLCVHSEIDAVVVSADGETIWVVEAKDLATPMTPRRIRSEVNKYFRPGGYVAKLSEKVRDIEADPGEVVRRLGGRPTSTPPQVKGLFVTREPTPALFHEEQVHTCVAVDRLPALLSG